MSQHRESSLVLLGPNGMTIVLRSAPVPAPDPAGLGVRRWADAVMFAYGQVWESGYYSACSLGVIFAPAGSAFVIPAEEFRWLCQQEPLVRQWREQGSVPPAIPAGPPAP